MPNVLNKRIDRPTPGAIYVGRPGPWGNPFAIGRDGNRAQVLALYEQWLASQPQLLARLDELRGRDLICWCAPQGCHADLLLMLANSDRAARIAWWRGVNQRQVAPHR
jgi:hypothetical protein